MLAKSYYQSPIGKISLLTQEDKLVGLCFIEQNKDNYILKNKSIRLLETPLHQRLYAWLDAYFLGKNPSTSHLPLAPEGTDFQKRVWQELLSIPYGHSISYGQLAKQLHCLSPQAIGSAVGRNPLLILIPCHRVLGSDGHLRGYAGGLERKQFLLTLEAKASF